MNVYDVLKERGFVEQVTDEESVRALLGGGGVTCYIGFDPTASSLHIGSLVPIMALAQMQRHGHRPIALVGGGTALIGDPSGKTEMRQILRHEDIDANADALQKQLARYIDFGGGKALLLNNADWLAPLKYIEFLRDIGRHFSVNRMLAAETYRMRMETGLNFIEFNYMLLQSYDFYYLCKHHNCLIQMGGNDQWGNIVAGMDLTRRMMDRKVFGLTFPLIVTSLGHKMGKTEKGTVWLDGRLTAPYEYFQYWINTDDADLARFLALFTYLPMNEIDTVAELKDAELNMAKTVLAFEATAITHGDEAAQAALAASMGAFNIRPVRDDILPSSRIPRTAASENTAAMPSVEIAKEKLKEGIPAFELFCAAQLCKSKGEAKRVLSQGGGYVNGEQIQAFDMKIGVGHADAGGEIRLRKGKKIFAIVRVR